MQYEKKVTRVSGDLVDRVACFVFPRLVGWDVA